MKRVVATDGTILITLMDLERSRAHLRIEYVSPRRKQTLTEPETRLALGNTITVHNVLMFEEKLDE